MFTFRKAHTLALRVIRRPWSISTIIIFLMFTSRKARALALRLIHKPWSISTIIIFLMFTSRKAPTFALRLIRRPWFILTIIIVLGTFLRFFALSNSYFYLIDSTVQISGIKNILLHSHYPYDHYAPPGPGIALAPFMMFFDFSIMSAQVGIAFYGVVLIGFSWMMVRRLSPNSHLAPLLVAFMVAINPALIVSSRVILFDVMQLVFIAAYFIVLTGHRSYQSRRSLTIAFSYVIGGFLVLMKTPNLMVVGLGSLYILGQPLMEKASAAQRRRQWVCTAIMLIYFFMFLWALYFIILPQEGTKVATAAQGQFRLQNFLPNLEALWLGLGNLLNPPATAVVFATNIASISPTEWLLRIAQVAVLVIGLVVSLRRRLFTTAFLLALGLSLAYFFLFFRGFMTRYYYPLLLVSLCFLGLGLETLVKKIVEHYRLTTKLMAISSVVLLVLVAVPVAMSLHADGEMLAAWNSKDSLRLNGLHLFPEDTREISEILAQHPDASVVSSVASFIDIVNTDQDRQLLDLHRLGIAAGSAEESLPVLEEFIGEAFSSGRDVLYVPGWYELINSNEGIRDNFGIYLDFVTSQYNASLVYIGENDYSRNRDQFDGNPRIRVYLVNKEPKHMGDTLVNHYLVGDWNGDGIDTLGLQRGNNWYLHNANDSGPPDLVFNYGEAGDIPLAGDWDGDGIDTIGVQRGNKWYLHNANDSGPPDLVFTYGKVGDIPLAGDWNGDGIDTIGVQRENKWYLRNFNDSGSPDLVFNYGSSGDILLVGDWNGDGIDTIGVKRGNNWYLNNSNSSLRDPDSGELRLPDLIFTYGGLGDIPFVGDWDGDGIDTIGVQRGSNWYLHNSYSLGSADIVFTYMIK